MAAAKVKLEDQKRQGLFPEHDGVAPVAYVVRATIPVVEALRDAGATVNRAPDPMKGYTVIPGPKMPAGIVAVHLNDPPHVGLRLTIEPEYPQEFSDYWAQVDFTPCPVCGAPVVWYEAGYVPGYRVCTQPPHHHSLAK
jgi:hypothetical protein